MVAESGGHHCLIVNLLNSYGLFYDQKDIEGVSDCYTPDAVFRVEVPGADQKCFTGKEAILANAKRTFGSITWTRLHVLSNHVITLTGGNTARATTYVQLIDNIDGEVSISMTGTYSDMLRRDGRVWRISERVLVADNAFQITRP